MAAIRPKYRADGTINGYHAPVRIAGHPPQTATFERKTDAKRWSAEIEAAIRQGRYFKTSRANQHTVAEAIDRFLAEVLPTRPAQRRDLESHLREWRKAVGEYSFSELTPSVVSSVRGFDPVIQDRQKQLTRSSSF